MPLKRLICCGVLAAHLTAGHAQIVSNGGFELPIVGPSGPITYSAGESFTGWTVDSGSVQLLAFQSPTGAQAVSLNGGLSQDIPTVPGNAYSLSLTAMFAGDDFPRFLTLSWDASSVILFPGDPPQGRHSVTFTANGATTHLRLFSPDYAVTLDDVVVEPIPRLSISSLDSGQAQITWSTNFPRHVLESATALPAAGWQPVTNRATIAGDRLSVTVDSASGQQIFRLREAQSGLR
jgi:hypothetical protein